MLEEVSDEELQEQSDEDKEEELEWPEEAVLFFYTHLFVRVWMHTLMEISSPIVGLVRGKSRIGTPSGSEGKGFSKYCGTAAMGNW